jgi:hypothetical protein
MRVRGWAHQVVSGQHPDHLAEDPRDDGCVTRSSRGGVEDRAIVDDSGTATRPLPRTVWRVLLPDVMLRVRQEWRPRGSLPRQPGAQ